MNGSRRQVLPVVVVVLLLCGASLALAVVDVPIIRVGAAAATEFVLLDWWAVFFELLPVVLGTTVLLTTSVLIRTYDVSSSVRLLVVFRPLMIVIFGLGVIQATWHIALSPAVQFYERQYEFQHEMALSAREQAETDLPAGNLEAAREKAVLYADITGDDAWFNEFTGELAAAEANRARNEAAIRRDASVEADPALPENQAVPELLGRAQSEYDAGRYYSAHYYASLAAEFDDTGRRDVQRLQSLAEQAIRDQGYSLADQDRREEFERVWSAYRALQRGTDSPAETVRSYYEFLELEQDYPDNPDVKEYARRAREQLATQTFFFEEARDARGLPGSHDLVFNQPMDGRREIVTIQKQVRTREAVYVYDVEILALDAAGEPAYHVRAPYGRFLPEGLLLHAVRRTPTAGLPNEYPPEYLEGAREEALSAFFPMTLTPGQIETIGAGEGWLASAGLPRLIRAFGDYQELGMSSTSLVAEALHRLVEVVVGFGVPMLLLGLGWRYRSHYLSRPPVIALLILPVAPVGVAFLIQLIRYALTVVPLAAGLRFGSGAGLILGVVVAAIFVAYSVSVPAREST